MTTTSPSTASNSGGLALGQTYGSANKQTEATADPTSQQFGKDTFLKLLVAQLRFQNPLSPTDGTEYIAQTAQFTMVESLGDIAKSTADASRASAFQTATSMVGKQVRYMLDGVAVDGTVTSAKLDQGGPMLVINGKDVPIDAVMEVRAAPASANPGGSAPVAAQQSAGLGGFVTLGSLAPNS
jgi:flagellar basal-body rod modification protein FlgD